MEQEKRQKEITRHGLIRVGLWLGGGWLLLVLCAWGHPPRPGGARDPLDRAGPADRGTGHPVGEDVVGEPGTRPGDPAGAHWWQAEKEELAAAAVMLAVWWGFLALCAAGCSPHGTGPVQLAPGGSGDHPLRGGAAALAEREADR